MARYRLKRKYYGVGDAVGNTLGGTMEGVGKALDTKTAGLAGGLAGGAALGGTIGDAIAGLGGPLSFMAKPVGYMAGAGIGAAAVRGVGKGLKSAGQDLQT